MVTMPSDVTSPNFSSGGSHGRSALPRPEPLCRQNGNRRHLCVCVKCSKSHTAPLPSHYLFMPQWILSITFSGFFYFWIMQPHGAHLHLWWNGTVVDGGGGKDGVRRHKQPARLVKKAISEAVMLYIVGIDRQSCFYRNAEPSVGAVCRSASTKWFGHVKAGTRVNPAGRCGFQKIASI